MNSAVRKIGNSLGVILGKKMLDQVGIKEDTKVEVQAQDGKIIIKPILKRRPINRDITTWRKQFKEAIKQGHKPEKAVLADTPEENKDWTWPQERK